MIFLVYRFPISDNFFFSLHHHSFHVVIDNSSTIVADKHTRIVPGKCAPCSLLSSTLLIIALSFSLPHNMSNIFQYLNLNPIFHIFQFSISQSFNFPISQSPIFPISQFHHFPTSLFYQYPYFQTFLFSQYPNLSIFQYPNLPIS